MATASSRIGFGAHHVMVSQACHTVRGMTGKLSAIDEVASRQRSLVTREQLLKAGFSRWEIAGLLRARALRVVRFRVYATVGSVQCWEQDLLAAVLASGDGAVASVTAAARYLFEVCVARPSLRVGSDVGVGGRRRRGGALRYLGARRTWCRRRQRSCLGVPLVGVRSRQCYEAVQHECW
jgi:hypothetical protein